MAEKTPATPDSGAEKPPKTVKPPAAQGDPPDDQVNPEDLNLPVIADYMARSLPATLRVVGGVYSAAPPAVKPPPPDPDVSDEQAVTDFNALSSKALLKDSSQLPLAVETMTNLGFLLYDIDPEAVEVNMPYNTDQVRAGAVAVIKSSKVDEAAAMKIDVPALAKRVAQSERIRLLRVAYKSALDVLDANESIVLSEIAETVNSGLKRGMSVIKSNGALLRALAPALAIKGDPIATGQATKGQNARLEATVRSDEQSKMAAATGEPPPMGSTTTVVTQAPTPVGTGAATQPKAPVQPTPAAPTHHKKPAK